MPEPIDQSRVEKLIRFLSDALKMPDVSDARQHSRLALLDYGYAYRNADRTSRETTMSLINSAWIHLEQAVHLGWNRQDIEDKFYAIRARYGSVQVPANQQDHPAVPS